MIRHFILFIFLLFLFSECGKSKKEIKIPSLYSGQIPSTAGRGEIILMDILSKDSGYTVETYLEAKGFEDSIHQYDFTWKIEDDTLLVLKNDSTGSFNYYKIKDNNFIIKLDSNKNKIKTPGNYILTKVK